MTWLMRSCPPPMSRPAVPRRTDLRRVREACSPGRLEGRMTFTLGKIRRGTDGHCQSIPPGILAHLGLRRHGSEGTRQLPPKCPQRRSRQSMTMHEAGDWLLHPRQKWQQRQRRAGYFKEIEELSRERDPIENAESTPPTDEEIRLNAVWMAESYPLS